MNVSVGARYVRITWATVRGSDIAVLWPSAVQVPPVELHRRLGHARRAIQLLRVRAGRLTQALTQRRIPQQLTQVLGQFDYRTAPKQIPALTMTDHRCYPTHA